jgi:hypothetical protein
MKESDEIKLTYRLVGDVMLPNVETSEAERKIVLTKFGSMRRDYLEKEHPVRFNSLLTQGKLKQHCLEIENQAQELKDTVMEQLRKQYQPPEKTDFMANVQYNYMINDMAEEVAIKEIVYGK